MSLTHLQEATGTVTLGLSGTTPADVVAVARHDAYVVLADEARAHVEEVRQYVHSLAESDTPVYGISTGFGALATRHIPQEQRTQLQKSLIRPTPPAWAQRLSGTWSAPSCSCAPKPWPLGARGSAQWW